mmetsp:Transcript_20262/g.50389  ORF Transcript_20262/g.50389 Transcript_20262/m.50389 type:complete len:247 (-) Transcript_20262:51-791(-)
MKQSLYSIWIALFLAVFCCCEAKKNFDLPHIHRGVLSSYEAGPFELELDSKDEKTLDQGKSVMKQTQGEGEELAGSSICVQDVEAPKEAVWKQILDLDAYKGKVPKVGECKNYVAKLNEDGTSTMKTKMSVKVIPGYGYTSFYDHTYHPERDSMTWRLDYDKTSDFDDVSGHWHLEPHPTKENCTRVFYACDIKLKGAVPGPVVNFVSKSALKAATGWVKKESEKNPAAEVDLAFVDKSKMTAGVE